MTVQEDKCQDLDVPSSHKTPATLIQSPNHLPLHAPYYKHHQKQSKGLSRGLTKDHHHIPEQLGLSPA